MPCAQESGIKNQIFLNLIQISIWLNKPNKLLNIYIWIYPSYNNSTRPPINLSSIQRKKTSCTLPFIGLTFGGNMSRINVTFSNISTGTCFIKKKIYIFFLNETSACEYFSYIVTVGFMGVDN